MSRSLKLPLKLGAVLLVLGAMLLPAQAAVNCLSYGNKARAECRNYQYDTIKAYFKDEQGLEHSADLHRVLQGQSVLHIDFDFVASAGLAGRHHNDQLTHVAWAFRQAVVNQQLYTKRWVLVNDGECDTSSMSCCDENGLCNDLNQVPEQPMDSDAFSIQGRRPNPNNPNQPGRPIEENIPIIDSALNLTDRMRHPSNGEQVVQEVVSKQQMPLRFSFITSRYTSESVRQIQVISGENYPHLLQGRVLETPTSVVAEFHDLPDYQIPPFIQFLTDQYKRQDNMCYPVSGGGCHGTFEVKCSITWRCDKL